jgi:predicted Zn-dependent protease
VREVASQSTRQVSWELRVLRDGPGNAFSLPDGAVYADTEMAHILAGVPGLWAAILAHEIVHITRQHAARQTAFEDSREQARADGRFFTAGALPLGAVFLRPSERDAQEDLAVFSQTLELEADEASLDLMARAGIHPDFMIALDHLMEVEEADSTRAKRFCATHPGWDARESGLQRRLSAAVAEFKRRWAESANSPGGNPPVLAFVDSPKVNVARDRQNAEVGLPLRCENSAGRAKVVLLVHYSRAASLPRRERTGQLEQTIACTPEKSTARFALRALGPGEQVDGEFHVMDDRGWVLAWSPRFRAEY